MDGHHPQSSVSVLLLFLWLLGIVSWLFLILLALYVLVLLVSSIILLLLLFGLRCVCINAAARTVAGERC
jgi:hypothetical protein